MPRSPRQFEVNGIYHIINRGYDRRTIFLDNSDHGRFIESLFYFNDHKPRKMCIAKNTGLTRASDWKPLVEILAFVLMPNHYHLILREIIEGGISKFMQKVGNSYTGYFNTRHKRVGQGGVFQSRYKAFSIEDDSQLLIRFVYVHTNPVEIIEPLWKKDWKVKNLKKSLAFVEQYPWSSYRDYIGAGSFPEIINCQFYTDFFNNNTKQIKQAVTDWIKFKAGVIDVRV